MIQRIWKRYYNMIMKLLSKSIKNKIYSIVGLMSIVVLLMVLIASYTSTTLTMVTSFARFERVHTVALSDAKTNLYKYLLFNDIAYLNEYKINISKAHSYSHTFSLLPELVTTTPHEEAVTKFDEIFTEVNRKESDIIITRTYLLLWHPIVKKLIQIAIDTERNTTEYEAVIESIIKTTNQTEKAKLFLKLKEIEVPLTEAPKQFSDTVGELADFSATVVSIALWVVYILLTAISGYIALLVIRTITTPLRKLNESFKSFANGIFEIKFDLDGEDEINSLALSANDLKKSLLMMSEDTTILVDAAINGNLSTRADANKHNGDFRKIVEGVNKTLNAIVTPINETIKVLKELSAGNLKMSIQTEYKGDYLIMKNSVNETIHSLNSYIAETTSILTSMANGNMDVEITGDYKGDFIDLKNTINQIIDSFNLILNRINISASEILLSANQLSDSSQSLSQGSSEQASSTEEVTTTLIQIENQAKANTDTAKLTNETTRKVNENATIGNSGMKDLLKAMEELNISSEKISKVIREIESIAFQTNILALNAAVEAARAGHHGKGFNVVATEVRNLAIRCANSAKESGAMVEDTIRKINLSSKMAQNASNSLNIIVDGIGRVNELIGGIAISSDEQTRGISQVNTGITQISSVTMSNSAAAEEMAAASQELAGQAESFNDMISKFEIKGEKNHEKQKKETKNIKKKIILKSN